MAISTQTKYRQRKIEISIECINLLISLALLKKKQLQRVHIAKFKKIKQQIEEVLFEATKPDIIL